MPHPNSLMYNVYPVFWPMKVFWFCRKSIQILFIRDFPPVPEGHPDEKIVRGDVRKVYVDVRVPFMYEGKVQIDGLKYRLYVKEGKTNIDVIEWTDINRAYNSNYFLLDTSMLIPNKEYYLDLQLETNREINTYRKEISFYVVNRK